MEATQELKEWMETLKCPKCGSGKLMFGERGFNSKMAKWGMVIDAIGGGHGGGSSGILFGLLGKEKLEAQCVECGKRTPLKDFQTSKEPEPVSEFVGKKTWFNPKTGRREIEK